MADSQSDFHNYTIVWTEELLTWKIDGATVRTMTYASALAGANYPQTPMRVKLGIWAGGDSSNSEGTIAWAGGATDYSAGPFTAFIKSISITNYNPASSYTYGDLTGSYESIVLDSSNSTSTTDSSSSSGTTGASSPLWLSCPHRSSIAAFLANSSPTGVTSSSSSNGTITTSSSNSTSSVAGSSNSTSYLNGTTSSSPPSSSSSSSGSSSSGSSSSSTSSASASASSALTTSAAEGLWTSRTLGNSAFMAVVGCAFALM